MNNSEEEKKAWREVKQINRFRNAFRGLKVFSAVTRHLSMHAFAALLAILFGYYFKISSLEWIAIIFSIGFVVIFEAINTAIEIDIDLTSPDYHPYAKDAKDVAAAAVLLAVFLSIVVGGIIFIPKILLIL